MNNYPENPAALPEALSAALPAAFPAAFLLPLLAGGLCISLLILIYVAVVWTHRPEISAMRILLEITREAIRKLRISRKNRER